MSKKKKNRSGKAAVEARKRKIDNNTVRYKCLECGMEEDVPRDAIELIDIFDDGDGAPEFDCKSCNGVMLPKERENSGETEYIISDGSYLDDDDSPL